MNKQDCCNHRMKEGIRIGKQESADELEDLRAGLKKWKKIVVNLYYESSGEEIPEVMKLIKSRKGTG